MSKLDLKTLYNMEKICNAIVIIGHERQFVLKNIRHIRRISNMPILVVYNLWNIHEKIEILDMGADDYRSLPYNEEELLAKIKATFRRAYLSAGIALHAIYVICGESWVLMGVNRNISKQSREWDIV